MENQNVTPVCRAASTLTQRVLVVFCEMKEASVADAVLRSVLDGTTKMQISVKFKTVVDFTQTASDPV